MSFPAICSTLKWNGSNLSTHLVSRLWYVLFPLLFFKADNNGPGDPFGGWNVIRIGNIWSVLATRRPLVVRVHLYCIFVPFWRTYWHTRLVASCCSLFVLGMRLVPLYLRRILQAFRCWYRNVFFYYVLYFVFYVSECGWVFIVPFQFFLRCWWWEQWSYWCWKCCQVWCKFY